MKRISLGVVIAIILIVYWYMHDHPNAFSPAKQGSLEITPVFAG
jgi:hypothetical protein